MAINTNTIPTATFDTTGDLTLRSTTQADNTTATKGLYMRYDGTNDIGLIKSIDNTTNTTYPLNI